MTLSTAQRNDNVSLRRYRVTEYGEDPASTALQELRFFKDGFKINKKTVKSKTVGSRQTEDIYKVGEDFNGSVSGEFAPGEWEWACENALGGSFTTFTTTQTDISFEAADSSINGSADFSSSVVAGQWIKIVGSPLNSGLWYVSSKSSPSKMILSNGVTTAGVSMTVQDESAGASVTVTGKHLRQGTSLKADTFEHNYKDNSTYSVWNSLVVDTLKLDFKVDALVEIEVAGIGKVGDQDNVASFGSSVTTAVTTAPFNGTNNLLRIKEGSTVLTDEMIAASIMIKTNARQRLALGQTTPQHAVQGTVEVTGNLDFYFKTNARRAAMQNHTSTTLYYILKGAAGAFFIITAQKLYYQDLQNSVEGQNADTLEKYAIEATKDGTYSQTVCMDVL